MTLLYRLSSLPLFWPPEDLADAPWPLLFGWDSFGLQLQTVSDNDFRISRVLATKALEDAAEAAMIMLGR